MRITANSTDRSVYYYIIGDADHAKPGEPIIGLVYSDIQTGGSASYNRQGAARVGLTLISLPNAGATHNDGGFIQVDAVNEPGLYRCDFPDAAWVAGVDQVFGQMVVDSSKNAVVTPLAIDLISINLAPYIGEIGYGVFVKSTAGNTNTILGIDGTFDNPVSTLAAAKTIATALGVKIFYVGGNSNFTVDAAYADWRWIGCADFLSIVINLGGQIHDRSKFVGLSLEGVQGGTERLVAERCALQNQNGPASVFHLIGIDCAMVDDITVDTSEDNELVGCYSLKGGSSAPVIRMSGSAGTLAINGYMGGIDLRDLSPSHKTTINLAGGQIIFDASCNGAAAVELRGIGKKTDNAGMTNLNEIAFLNLPAITSSVWNEILSRSQYNIPNSAGRFMRTAASNTIHDDIAQGPGVGVNQIQLSLSASSVDGTYDPAMIYIKDGACAGQTRLILQYSGVDRICTVDRNWKGTVPDDSSEYVIVAHAGRNHVNEGLVRSAGSNWVQLNALASEHNKTYRGQLVFIRSGTGDDQAGLVISYDGATKIAIIDKDWEHIPDGTSGYAMIPASPVLLGATEHVGAIIPGVEKLLKGIIFGVAEAGTLSTTQATTDLTGYGEDQLTRAVIVVLSGPAEGERKPIVGNVVAGGLITFNKMKFAMEPGDDFKII